ncbi:MAG: hypothetical protein IJN17_07355 [Clostridia bacterium]|nr:hypothetical protein [Clostridia bacterium]
MKKAIGTVVLLLFVILLSIPASGAGADGSVVHNISPFSLAHAADGVLNDFSETNEGWDCSASNTEVTLAESIASFPYMPLNGEGCLIVRSGETSSGQKKYIEKNYSMPLDLSEYQNVIFVVNCSDVSAEKYYLNVKFYSNRKAFEITEEITPDGWSGVFADVSAFKEKDKISKIELCVYYESKLDNDVFFEYYVDAIMLSENDAAYNIASLSAERYIANGGSVSHEDGLFTVSGIGDEVSLTSSGFAYGNMGDANSLMIDFVTEGYCQGVRLFVKRNGGAFEETGYSAVNMTNSPSSVYLPLSGDGIDGVRIEFEGVKLGKVKVIGILPASYVFEDDSSGVEITTCVLNSGTGEIFIRGSVDRSLLSDNGGELHLFASDLCDSVSPDALATVEPIQKNKISSDDFIFRVGFDSRSDGRTLICKKFTVAVKGGSGYIAVGQSKCVANPEDLAEKSIKAPGVRNGKGVYGESISFMQIVGASDTAIWVDIGKFFVQESGGTTRFECGGNLYYYNLEYFTTIDSMISNYAEKDIDVTLIFVISDTGNESLNRVLIHKDAALDSKYCAYNTADRQGLAYLRAITNFFSSRYLEKMQVSRIVFGDCVGNAFFNYNMGKKTLDEFAEQYANGLRVIYNTARSYSPYVEIYTYIDDNWDKGLPFDLYVRYDNKAFLDVLNGCISGFGDIDWGVVQNPYPMETSDYFSYDDQDLDTDMLTDRVSFKNIGVITDYLKRTELTYNNSVRDYIIIEQSNFKEFSEEYITADYVYNCYKAMNSGVSAYITDRGCNYNNAMKYVDTNYSLTVSGFVSEVLGVATWENVIEGFSGKNIEKRTITIGKVVSTKPNIVGRLPMSDFSGDSDGWLRYGFTERLAGGGELSGKSELLSLSLGNVPKGESRGMVKIFDSPFNMTNSPILHFEINVASLPTNIDSANITVYVKSGNNSYELNGIIKEAVWTELYCDFSAFSGLDKVDSIGIIFTADENYYDSPQALFTAMELVSTEYDSDMLREMNINSSGTEELMNQMRKHLYPVLAFVIAVAAVLFVWRRVKRVK